MGAVMLDLGFPERREAWRAEPAQYRDGEGRPRQQIPETKDMIFPERRLVGGRLV